MQPTYHLTRFFILRFLAIVYLFAFLSFVNDAPGLLGENGILPTTPFLDAVEQHSTIWSAFQSLPSIFWLNSSDTALLTVGWIGVLLSILLLIGYGNSITLFIQWFLYMSIVHIGQRWYSFGWEIQLLETGFLAIFLAPMWDWRPFPRSSPSTIVIYLFRWLAFRIHIGSGLIKLRGDTCWQDLTCLFYHFETQPIPHFLSPLWHALPQWILKIGTLFSHIVQLIAPWFLFFPRIFRHSAGLLMLLFQLTLIASGNLAFLNWITIVPIIAAFDDSILMKITPRWLSHNANNSVKKNKIQILISIILLIAVALLSIPVINNLTSDHQAMNTSFNQLHLVNTYGAFGSITKDRYELIIEGSLDNSDWKEYQFKAKPSNTSSIAPFLGPYHYRLDWLMWFAAFSTPQQHPWSISLVWKLLNNEPVVLDLIKYNPFPDIPPKYIRIHRYHYTLNSPFAEEKWTRTGIDEWIPPLSKNQFH